MKNFIQRLKTMEPQVQPVMPVQRWWFTLQYTYPKCPLPVHIKGMKNTFCFLLNLVFRQIHSVYVSITDMDPAINTVEDLMLTICHLESVGNSKGVCLYAVDGMPLTDDPFFNTCEHDAICLFKPESCSPTLWTVKFSRCGFFTKDHILTQRFFSIKHLLIL